MNTQALHGIAHRWFDEVWNQASADTLEELVHPDCLAYGFPDNASPVGAAEFKMVVANFRQTFSDIQMTIVDVVAEPATEIGAARFAAHWSATMKQTGLGLVLPPTGATVSLMGISLAHIEDGKIIRAWNAQNLTAAIAELQALNH